VRCLLASSGIHVEVRKRMHHRKRIHRADKYFDGHKHTHLQQTSRLRPGQQKGYMKSTGHMEVNVGEQFIQW